MSKRAPLLLVEDDPDIRDTLAEILVEEGYPVECASDGAEALDRMRAHHPALVLLDLMMPGMSGEEFRAAQRADPALAGIPVVLLTADGSIEHRARALGATDAVRKPIDVPDLLALLARLL
jgi:CheY-like chemotaxis protein